MPTCPQGHQSEDDEFCDVCGREIGGSPGAAPTAAAPATEPELPAAGATCKACGAVLAGRFCEACGQDSLAEVATPPPVTEPEPVPSVPMVPTIRMPGGAAWTATVTADRAYYDSVMAVDGPDAAGIAFPQYCPDRHFPLQGKQISIGRQSKSRGILPDIDLLGPPEDPGVSHLHALLIAREDGGWSLVDLDSANGTILNDEPNPLRPNDPRPLENGDRVYIGAWTRITLRRS